MILSGEAPAEAGAGVVGVETGGGAEVAALEATMVAVEVVRWGEVGVVRVVAAPAGAAGVVTSGSGKRASQLSTPNSLGSSRTGWSPGSKLKMTTRLNYLFVRSFSPTRTQYSPFHFEGPGWGTQGQPGAVRANFFTIRLPKDPIYDYTVKITPDPNRWVKERIFHLLERDPKISPLARFIAHDKGERLVSARQLEQPLEVTINHTDEGAPPTSAKPYQVEITLKRILDPNELTK